MSLMSRFSIKMSMKFVKVIQEKRLAALFEAIQTVQIAYLPVRVKALDNYFNLGIK